MKKLIIYTTVGVMVVVSGVFISGRVNAQELDSRSDSFFSRLASQLGLEEEEVVDVVDDIRNDMQAERQAERVEIITQALDNGNLSERQAEILNAMEDIKPVGRSDDWEEWKDYTPEQREALREAREETRKQDIIDALYNDYGLEVSQEEMDELHNTMMDLGIGMYGKRGDKGLGIGGRMGGRGMGNGDGECNI